MSIESRPRILLRALMLLFATLVVGHTQLRADLLISSWGTSGTHGIYNRDEDTGLATAFPNDPSSFLQLNNANGVMIGPDGLLYAASSSPAAIYTFDPLASNVAASKIDFLASAAVKPTHAHGLIFDGDGNLYVSDQDAGKILKYDPAGTYLGVHAEGLGFVRGMAFLADDSGRMVAAGANHYLIETDGSFDAFSQSTPTKASGGQGVAIDADGNVLLSNTGGYADSNVLANAVARFTPDGQWIEDVVVSDFSNTFQSGGLLNQGQHFGLLEGPQGDVFLAKKHGGQAPAFDPTNAILRFDSNGLPSGTGVPSFGGRDWHSGSVFNDEVRYMWLWDADDDGSGYSDPITKQYVTSLDAAMWNNPLGGDWDEETNWAPNAPQPGGDVVINPADFITVVGPAAATALNQIQIGGDGGGNPTLQLQASGPLSAGQITIAANGQLAGTGQVSGLIEGDGAIFASSGLLTVGNGSSVSQFALGGTLLIDSGATLRLNYNQPLALGIPTEMNGGTLASASDLALSATGRISGFGEVSAPVANSGEITAFGGTLTFSNRLDGVGLGVSGSIAFSSTGSFHGQGDFAGSVSGAAGSNIVATGDLAIGNAANPNGFATSGSLNVDAHTVVLRAASQAQIGGSTTISGGTLTAPNGIEQLAGGEIRIQGNNATIAGGTFSNAGRLRIVSGTGHEIAAALDNQLSGSITTVDDFVFSGASNLNNGRINVVDATLVFEQPLVNGPTGEINAINAVLQVDGDMTNQGALNLINTVVEGNVVGSAPIVLAGSNEFVGDASGAFDVSIQLRDGAGDHDRLTIHGHASFSGSLAVSLGGGFEPIEGSEFIISTFDSHEGLFAPVLLPSLAESLDWLVEYGEQDLTLSVVTTSSGPVGDVSGDGMVNRRDVALLSLAIGRTDATSPADGDFNDDGVVNLVDAALLQANYGAGPLAPSPAAVPEPTSAALLGISAVGLFAAARRRRGQSHKHIMEPK